MHGYQAFCSTLRGYFAWGGRLTASDQGPTHTQSVASIACVQRAEADFGGAGPHVWHDGSYHVQFSMFLGTGEDVSDWNKFHVLFYEPDRKTGWVYNVYLRRTTGMVQIGKRGAVKKKRHGGIEIDWGDSGGVNVFNERFLVWGMGFEPAVKVLSTEVGQAGSQCYDKKNPAPD